MPGDAAGESSAYGQVSVVIPAYNEADRVASTVAGVRAGAGYVREVLVVDDGSTDGTAHQARQAGARVIVLDRRSGKGAALTEGARRARGEIVVFLDADVGESSAEITRLIEPVARGDADMAIARFARGSGRRAGFGIVRRVAALGVRLLCKAEVTAPLSGQRAARRDALLEMAPFAPGFGVEIGLTVDAVRRGYRILEVDCAMTHRETGRNAAGFIHRARQLYWILRALGDRIRPSLRGREPQADRLGTGRR